MSNSGSVLPRGSGHRNISHHPRLEDGEKESGVNVKVILRIRPTLENERRDPSQFVVVHSKPENREVVVSQTIPGKRIDSYSSKTFTFDGVCNQFSSQADVFDNHILPIVDEVLQGFNCTIFAYGQTGTGKTYTMEGDLTGVPLRPDYPCQHRMSVASNSRSSSPSLPPEDAASAASGSVGGGAADSMLSEGAGVIPRSVKRVFDCLESSHSEYSVRVSYLEIYNEELNDLLNEGDKQNLRIYEETSGKRGLSVDKLEEMPVNNPQDIYNILAVAVKKRRTAETLLNRVSSRSHCIFSITIHMKESNSEGEDVIKIGKLNLVDLAGSENIQRSGANTIKDRAKEAGMINQSLLTLGRVINALVEHASYVPYRDSKLTRLLQESLGGKTKTCIVATVSPSSVCLEETLSTLDYAHRAKNIRNRPEVNQKMSKRVMVKELTLEIEKLRLELLANREKNGVYLSLDKYQEMEAKIAGQTGEIGEIAGELKKQREDLTLEKSRHQQTMTELHHERREHEKSQSQLSNTKQELQKTTETLLQTRTELQEVQTVMHKVRQSEISCYSTAHQLDEYLRSSVATINVLWEASSTLVCSGTADYRTAALLAEVLSASAVAVADSMKKFAEWHFTSITKFQDQDMSVAKELKDFCYAFEGQATAVKQKCQDGQARLSAELRKLGTDVLDPEIDSFRQMVASKFSSFASQFHESHSSAESDLKACRTRITQCGELIEAHVYHAIEQLETNAAMWRAEHNSRLDQINRVGQKNAAILDEQAESLSKVEDEVRQGEEESRKQLSEKVTLLKRQIGELMDGMLSACEDNSRKSVQRISTKVAELKSQNEEGKELVAEEIKETCAAFEVFSENVRATHEAAKAEELKLKKNFAAELCPVREGITDCSMKLESLSSKLRESQKEVVASLATKADAWSTEIKNRILESEKQCTAEVAVVAQTMHESSEEFKLKTSEHLEAKASLLTEFVQDQNQNLANLKEVVSVHTARAIEETRIASAHFVPENAPCLPAAVRTEKEEKWDAFEFPDLPTLYRHPRLEVDQLQIPSLPAASVVNAVAKSPRHLYPLSSASSAMMTAGGPASSSRHLPSPITSPPPFKSARSADTDKYKQPTAADSSSSIPPSTMRNTNAAAASYRRNATSPTLLTDESTNRDAAGAGISSSSSGVSSARSSPPSSERRMDSGSRHRSGLPLQSTASGSAMTTTTTSCGATDQENAFMPASTSTSITGGTVPSSSKDPSRGFGVLNAIQRSTSRERPRTPPTANCRESPNSDEQPSSSSSGGSTGGGQLKRSATATAITGGRARGTSSPPRAIPLSLATTGGAANEAGDGRGAGGEAPSASTSSGLYARRSARSASLSKGSSGAGSGVAGELISQGPAAGGSGGGPSQIPFATGGRRRQQYGFAAGSSTMGSENSLQPSACSVSRPTSSSAAGGGSVREDSPAATAVGAAGGRPRRAVRKN